MPDTPSGLRDRAIILTLVLTGRRKTEVMDLKAGDIMQAGMPFLHISRQGRQTGQA